MLVRPCRTAAAGKDGDDDDDGTQSPVYSNTTILQTKLLTRSLPSPLPTPSSNAACNVCSGFAVQFSQPTKPVLRLVKIETKNRNPPSAHSFESQNDKSLMYLPAKEQNKGAFFVQGSIVEKKKSLICKTGKVEKVEDE